MNKIEMGIKSSKNHSLNIIALNMMNYKSKHAQKNVLLKLFEVRQGYFLKRRNTF